MRLSEGISIHSQALFLEKESAIVIGDMQLGYEESMNRKGILMPRHQYKEIERSISSLIGSLSPKTVIINGDIKHEFGTITETEWRGTMRLFDMITSKAELILIKGNHDTLLGPISGKKSLLLVDHILLGETYICHGHKIPEDSEFRKAKKLIIGHEHPAVSLSEGGRSEKYKCFLKGSFRGKDLIVMPSFNPLTEGTDILRERLLSPFLEKGVLEFEVYIAGNEILYFGKAKNIMRN